MQSLMITGHTRLIGKAQGYRGLAIRDTTIWDTVNGPGTPCMVTAWEPTPAELEALNRGQPVEVLLLGQAHPPINVSVGGKVEDSKAQILTAIKIVRAHLAATNNLTKPQGPDDAFAHELDWRLETEYEDLSQ